MGWKPNADSYFFQRTEKKGQPSNIMMMCGEHDNFLAVLDPNYSNKW